MKTVVIVRDGFSLSAPVAVAFTRCFKARGWQIGTTANRIDVEPDLVAGWGFRQVMHDAWDRWPDKVLHVDAGFWGRDAYQKVALGGQWGRWSSLDGCTDEPSRFKRFDINVSKNRLRKPHILICGMSAKAARSWGMEPEEWESNAIKKLRAAGMKAITYRPKPTWPDAKPLLGADYDRSSSIALMLGQVSGVVSHHSNAAIDALAAGLPIFVEIGIAKALSVNKIEDIIGAEAPDIHTRLRCLQQVAWQQWTLAELQEGVWLQPPAPLADHPMLQP